MNRREWVLAAGLAVAAAGCGPAGGDPNKVVIVSSLPRTGSAQGQTDTIVNGVKMAIDEYDGKAGPFAVQYLDWDDATAAAGQWTAEAETANAQKAKADPDVVAYIGPYNSGAAVISMPILNEAGIAQVSPAATAIYLTKKADDQPGAPDIYRPTGQLTFCRIVPADDVQGPLSADFAKDELKVKKVYVLDDTQVYGRGVATLFAQRCKEIGVEVLGHESINEVQQEFGALMTKIKAAGPDLLYFGGTTQTKAGQLAKDMVKAGLTCPMMAPDGCYENSFITSAGADNVNGRAYVTFGGADPSQLTGPGADFVARYKAKYNKPPEAYAVYGYEAGKLVMEAIKKAGVKDREAIRKAVLGTKDFAAGALGTWSFDANGDTTLKILTVSRVENGAFKPVKTFTK